LKLAAPDGKQRVTDCANTEGLFRIIQSIPSPRAEPFKRWLAQVGYERVREIENPELAGARVRELYQAKGYPPAWIEKRLRSIAVRARCSARRARRRSRAARMRRASTRTAVPPDKAGRAGNARKDLEAKTGRPVVSRSNYLALDGDSSETKPFAAYLPGAKSPKPRRR
jgi:hypothetical protein